MTTLKTKAELKRERAVEINEKVKGGDPKETAKLKRQLRKLGLL